MTGKQAFVAKKVSRLLQLPVQWLFHYLIIHTVQMTINGVQGGIWNMSPGEGGWGYQLKACPRGLDFRHNRSLPRGEWNKIEAGPGPGHLQVCPLGVGTRYMYNISLPRDAFIL